MRRCWRREEVQESQGPRVPRSRGPKDQVISNSNSNTSLTLKKVHLVCNSAVGLLNLTRSGNNPLVYLVTSE